MSHVPHECHADVLQVSADVWELCAQMHESFHTWGSVWVCPIPGRLRSSSPGQFLGSYVVHRVFAIRLVLRLGWVFENRRRRRRILVIKSNESCPLWMSHTFFTDYLWVVCTHEWYQMSEYVCPIWMISCGSKFVSHMYDITGEYVCSIWMMSYGLIDVSYTNVVEWVDIVSHMNDVKWVHTCVPHEWCPMGPNSCPIWMIS